MFHLLWAAFEQQRNLSPFPANIYLFKVNNRNTGTNCEICSKLTIKAPEQCYWRRSVVFIVNFEHISHLFLVLLLLTSNKEMLAKFPLKIIKRFTTYGLIVSWQCKKYHISTWWWELFFWRLLVRYWWYQAFRITTFLKRQYFLIYKFFISYS